MDSSEQRVEWVAYTAKRSWIRRLEQFASSGMDLWTLLLSIVALIALGFASVLLPPPRINLALRQLRVGRKTIAFEDISAAYLVVENRIKTRDLYLRIGIRRGTQLDIKLTDGDNALQVPATKETLIEILDASSIDDGRFAEVGLTKSQAIELVRSPPRPKDKLPHH